MPEPNGVNSVPSKVMMMMTTISSTINRPSIIATLLMTVMTPFLINAAAFIISSTIATKV
jgi:hypothetical protein